MQAQRRIKFVETKLSLLVMGMVSRNQAVVNLSLFESGLGLLRKLVIQKIHPKKKILLPLSHMQAQQLKTETRSPS